MRLRAFSSIGELRLFGNALHPSQPGFDSRKDFLDIKVANEDLSDLAVALIQRVGVDASEELIDKCRELAEFADKHLKPSDDQRKAFIKSCEENAGEYCRKGETEDQYYERLKGDYGNEFKTD